MAAILIAVAFAFRPEIGETAAARAAFASLLVVEAIVTLYWATVGRTLASIRPALVGAACAAGVVTLSAQALDVSSGWPVAVQALAVASFLSSAGLLGGACTAMVLGHWYLVIPSMQVEHLQSIAKVHIASVVLRIVVAAAAIFVSIAIWQPGAGPNFQRYIFSVAGIFFWQRVLFGLAGPAVLSYLTWETAKIRSTQSATGILYVDFFFVVVGEVLAKYLFLATRVPV
jgi:protein NrfD